MPIQLSQSDLDAKSALLKGAAQAYYQILGTMKDDLGDLPGHLSLNDNPHGLTKAHIGLGNVPNSPPATTQQSLSGVLNDRLSTPQGSGAQVGDRLSAIKVAGYSVPPYASTAPVISRGHRRHHVDGDKTITVSLGAGQRAVVTVTQGAIAHSVTWPSGVHWVLTENNRTWSHSEEESWDEVLVATNQNHWTSSSLVSDYNAGINNTSIVEYKNARREGSSEPYDVYVEKRTATITPPTFDIAYGRWRVEVRNTGGYLYGKSTYLGREVNDTVRSQTPHSTDDRVVTVEAATPYVGTLNPGGPAEYTNAQFTRDVFDALGWADSSKVDPSLVTWEIFNSPDGRVIYVPSRPLFDAVSYNALLVRKLLHGDTTVTLPTRGDWQSGNWYLPTAHATFRVVTPEAMIGSYYASPYRTTIDGNTLPTPILRGSARARVLRSLLSPAERALYPFASGEVSVANYTAADLGIANGEKEWGRTIASNGLRAIAASGLFSVSWHELNELAGWRPFLIADYETTLS